ncbi:TPA: hypothetical protein ACGZ9U_003697 [Elizabethkingia anophelis]
MFKVQVQKLEKELLEIEKKIQRRHKYFNLHSTTWRESMQGKNFRIQSIELENLRTELLNLIETLKNWNKKN